MVKGNFFMQKSHIHLYGIMAEGVMNEMQYYVDKEISTLFKQDIKSISTTINNW